MEMDAYSMMIKGIPSVAKEAILETKIITMREEEMREARAISFLNLHPII